VHEQEISSSHPMNDISEMESLSKAQSKQKSQKVHFDPWMEYKRRAVMQITSCTA